MPSAMWSSIAAQVARSKSPRIIQAQLAHQLARKLQAKRLGSMAVL
jgi:hypothetical protein